MKKITFFTIGLLLSISNLTAQDLHSQANAVSVNNEANATTGWSGDAALTSDALNANHGSYALKAVSTNTDGRTVEYRFTGVVGQQYTIRIWARAGERVSTSPSPAFAVWSGVSGFQTTPISSEAWTEYVFNVTATSRNCLIRIYTSSSANKNVAGNTIYLDQVSILPVDNQAPTAVTTLAANNTTANTTQLSWSASTDNIGVAEYQIFQDGNLLDATTSLTYAVSGLSGNTTYAFTVLAVDAAGNVSAPGNNVSITTLANSDTQRPSRVTSLSASNTTGSSTQLSWNASTDNVGVVGYQVFQDQVLIANPSDVSYSVTSLSSNTSYVYTVLAVDAAGNVSRAGNSVTVTTLTEADTEAPSAVTTLSASNVSTNSVNFSWESSTDNVGVVSYQIFRNGSAMGTTTTNSYSVSGLTSNTSYTFRVSASDLAGNVSLAGNEVVVTTLSGEAVPYTTHNANLSSIDWETRDLFVNQNLGIGTHDTQGYRLAVAGKVVAEGVKVALESQWPDYVFLEDYLLPSLNEVEQHILEKGHLIDVPNAKEIVADGIDLGEMNAVLLRKIEELTLYTIQQENKIKALEKSNERIDKIEKTLTLLKKEIQN